LDKAGAQEGELDLIARNATLKFEASGTAALAQPIKSSGGIVRSAQHQSIAGAKVGTVSTPTQPVVESNRPSKFSEGAGKPAERWTILGLGLFALGALLLWRRLRASRHGF
jgi:hypothetical protein